MDAGTFDTNKLTVTPNGSANIEGINDNFTAETERQAGHLVYVDSTNKVGFYLELLQIQDSMEIIFVAATGGTVTTVDTDFKVHRFTGDRTFVVTLQEMLEVLIQLTIL